MVSLSKTETNIGRDTIGLWNISTQNRIEHHLHQKFAPWRLPGTKKSASLSPFIDTEGLFWIGDAFHKVDNFVYSS